MTIPKTCETMRFRAARSMVPCAESWGPLLPRFSATRQFLSGTTSAAAEKAESREEIFLHDFLNGVLRYALVVSGA